MLVDTVLKDMEEQGITVGANTRNIVEAAVVSTVIALGPVIEATWQDQYPDWLKDFMVKGRKLFRKQRLIERILVLLPPIKNSRLSAWIASCGELK